jgi:hypothetical protein
MPAQAVWVTSTNRSNTSGLSPHQPAPPQQTPTPPTLTVWRRGERRQAGAKGRDDAAAVAVDPRALVSLGVNLPGVHAGSDDAPLLILGVVTGMRRGERSPSGDLASTLARDCSASTPPPAAPGSRRPRPGGQMQGRRRPRHHGDVAAPRRRDGRTRRDVRPCADRGRLRFGLALDCEPPCRPTSSPGGSRCSRNTSASPTTTGNDRPGGRDTTAVPLQPRAATTWAARPLRRRRNVLRRDRQAARAQRTLGDPRGRRSPASRSARCARETTAHPWTARSSRSASSRPASSSTPASTSA